MSRPPTGRGTGYRAPPVVDEALERAVTAFVELRFGTDTPSRLTIDLIRPAIRAAIAAYEQARAKGVQRQEKGGTNRPPS